VHVQADRPVVVERRDTVRRRWVAACSGTCDAELPVTDTYRVIPEGARNSAAFHLQQGEGGRVVLDVKPASKATLTAGFVGLAAGGGSLAIGGALLYFNWFSSTMSCIGRGHGPTTGSCPGPDPGVNTVALFTMGVGAAVAVTGAVLVLTSHHSSVQQSTDAIPVRNDSWLRFPQWREESAGPGAPRVFGGEILSGTF
jgi:hypothetical protein